MHLWDTNPGRRWLSAQDLSRLYMRIPMIFAFLVNHSVDKRIFYAIIREDTKPR